MRNQHDLEVPTVRLAGEIVCTIIGLGGVGQILATYLVRFLAGLKRPARVVLVDGDVFNQGNETRMSVPALHENKAEALQADLAESCPSPTVTVLAVPDFVRADNLPQLVRCGGAVLLCVDNHATRKLVGEYVTTLDDVCLVSGGNDGVGPDSTGAMRRGTAGNVQLYERCGGNASTPTIVQLHPEIADPPDDHPDATSCGDLVASVPQILFTNLWTAACMLSTWWLWACGEHHYSELVFDMKKGRAAPVLPLAPSGRPPSGGLTPAGRRS